MVKGDSFGFFVLIDMAFKKKPLAMTKVLVVPTSPVGLTLKLGGLMKMVKGTDDGK